MEKNKNIDICVWLNHFAVYLKHNIVNQLHFNLKKKKKLLSDQGCIGLDFVNPCPPDHPAVFILAPGRGHRYRSPGHPPPTAPCWDTSSSCVSREKRNVCSVHSKRCPQIPPPQPPASLIYSCILLSAWAGLLLFLCLYVIMVRRYIFICPG